jgi:hypothetical protein
MVFLVLNMMERRFKVFRKEVVLGSRGGLQLPFFLFTECA